MDLLQTFGDTMDTSGLRQRPHAAAGGLPAAADPIAKPRSPLPLSTPGSKFVRTLCCHLSAIMLGIFRLVAWLAVLTILLLVLLGGTVFPAKHLPFYSFLTQAARPLHLVLRTLLRLLSRLLCRWAPTTGGYMQRSSSQRSGLCGWWHLTARESRH